MASGLIDLQALLSQKVISGSRSTTAQNVRDFEREFLSSALNIVDGGLVVQALAGYSSILTPTDPKHWTSKKYVDDAISGAVPSGVLFAANNLSDISNASAARTNLSLAIGTNVQAWSANLDSWSALAPTAKLSVDGSLSMTGDLDLNSHDLKRVSQIKDPSGVVSLVPSTRLLKDSSGNTIAIWGSQTNGFGIQTASWAAYLKGTNLSQVSTFEFPNVVSGTLALTSDLTSYLPLTGGTLSGNLNGVTPTELGYVSGVTSNIQTQLNSKGSGTVTSVSGTVSRVTSSGGTTPVIDISATFEALLGKVASPLSQFASTTSAQLAGVISDETGTGALVFANSPTLITPALGTPSALVGTNISGTASGLTAGNVTTNANLTGEVTSVGNAATLLNSAVIGKVITGYISGAGTVAATDTILQAIQKLNGNDALKISTSLSSANIIVGNVSNLAAAVSMSGDITIDNTGATTIGANKVTYTKSYNGNQLSIVATMKLLTGN